MGVKDVDADMTIDLKNRGGGEHDQRGISVEHRFLQADGAEAEEISRRHHGELGNHDVK